MFFLAGGAWKKGDFMVPRTAQPSRSLRSRLAKRGMQVALPLILSSGVAVMFTSTPASAATTSTDSIIIFNGSSQTVEPLPAGTPDVVTPLATTVSSICSGPGVGTGTIAACGTEQFGPAAGTVVIVAVGSVAVFEPTTFGGGVTNCIVVATSDSSAIGLAPPGPLC